MFLYEGVKQRHLRSGYILQLGISYNVVKYHRLGFGDTQHGEILSWGNMREECFYALLSNQRLDTKLLAVFCG